MKEQITKVLLGIGLVLLGTNIGIRLPQLYAPSIADVMEQVQMVTIQPTIDTNRIVVTLTLQDKQEVSLWTEGMLEPQQAGGCMVPCPEILPTVTVMPESRVRLVTYSFRVE